MKKLLLLTSILMLALGLSTVTFAAKEMFLRDPISKIEVTIPPVYDGKTQIKKEDITLSKGLEISSMSWANVTGHAFMTDNETYRNKSVYSVRIYIKTTGSYKFADTVEATVNGKKVEDPFEYDGKRVVDAEFTATINEKELSVIKFTIKAPEYGKELDRNPVAITKGVVFDHIYWEAKDITPAGGWVGLNNEGDKAEYETDYQATIFFKLEDGYSIKGVKYLPQDLKIGIVNDATELSVKVLSVQPHNIQTQKFTVTKPEEKPEETKPEETKPEEKEEVKQPVLTDIDITVDEPTIGKALPTTYKVKSNLVEKATEYKIGEEKEDNLGTWTPADKEVKPGSEYTFKLEIALKNSMAEISKDLKITINKKIVKPTIKDGIYTVEYDFETEKPIEEKLYNHFEFEIDAPKIGEKLPTTAKALSDNYKVTKVEWLTKDEKFVEGETYKVQIHFDLINKNVRSDYFATINGKTADLPNGDENYQKNTMYAEFTFPTLRDSSKTATWTNASAWALEELSKAAEKGLIPDSLNKQDLTKNVTRKEFAHIAVRLYEAITGNGIFVTNAPFADTDDVEVAKAYTVGITTGTSETTFSPDKEITREQMATMMTRALEKAYIDTFVDLTKVDKFADDADLHDWSREAVYFMASVDIIKGIGNNNFGATGTATREQAVVIAIRSLDKFAR